MEILNRLRKMYGNKFQIMVCIEELNELACVLCKYPRYRYEEQAVNELHDKVLDEYVDSALDRLAISGIINLLNEIKLENDFYNIYVISHRSEVLSEFGGNQLIVRKTNGISRIES